MKKKLIGLLGAILISLGGSYFVAASHEAALGNQGKIPGYSYATSPPFIGWDDARLLKLGNESPLDFVMRANEAVAQAIYNCHPNPGGLKFLPGKIGKLTREHGLLSATHIRCGYCHQSAYVLSRALRNNGIDAVTYGVGGHVVTLVWLDGQSWIVDPDWGVGPFKVDVRSKEEMSQLAPSYATVTQVDLVGGMEKIYSNTDDDDLYYSSQYLDYIADGQDFYLRMLKLLSGLCISLGVFLIACVVKPDCRPCRWVRERLLRTLALFRRKSR